MICPQCAHENPEDHKFCGECGAKLPPRPFVVNDYFQDRRQTPVAETSPMMKDAAVRGNGLNSTVTRSRETFTPRSDREIEDTSIHEFPARQEGLDRLEEQRAQTVSRTGPTHYSGGISGPSFLGLGSDPPQEKGFIYDDDSGEGSEEAYDGSYLLEETPRGTSWKAYALLLILMIFGGLGYLQWKSQLMRPPSVDVSNVLSKNGDTIPEGGIPDFAKEKEKQDQDRQRQNSEQSAANANGVTADSSKNSAAQDTQSANPNAAAPTSPEKAGTEKAGSAGSDGANASTSPAGVTVKSNGAHPQEGVTVSTDGKQSKADSEEDAKPESDSTDVPDRPVNSKTQRATKASVEEAPQSLGAKDPLLIRAQKFLHGRGVPQDCRTGLNLLRQSAETNPKAQIQMGALYMTGHCVTQDRVSAYKWFSQALAQEPNNSYIERNRASLWANMTPEERNRVRHANFY